MAATRDLQIDFYQERAFTLLEAACLQSDRRGGLPMPNLLRTCRAPCSLFGLCSKRLQLKCSSNNAQKANIDFNSVIAAREVSH